MTTEAAPTEESAHAIQLEPALGALHGEVWLTIQTLQAESMIRGRRGATDKPPIMGLLRFAERLKTLWHAIRLDDPYADWWLLKVEDAIAYTRTRLQVLQQGLEDCITADGPLEYAVAQSSRPHRVSLQFANPYAFRAAQLLGEYDRLMCTDMTLRHLGIDRSDELNEQVSASGRWIRRVFALPQGYHHLDIRRDDIRRDTPIVDKARERMGEIPKDILSGDRLPSLRPVAFQLHSSASSTAEVS